MQQDNSGSRHRFSDTSRGRICLWRFLLRWEWVLAQGFTLFAAEGARSQTLTCGRNDGRTDLEALKKLAAERGYAIDNGYGKIKNETFRIPHMADMIRAKLDILRREIDEELPELRRRCGVD